MKRKIVLFHPRTGHEQNYGAYWLPYSLLSIASELDGLGLDIELIDNNEVGIDDMAIIARRIPTDCVVLGITAMIGHQMRECRELARAVKQLCPKLPVVVGGALPTMLPELAIEGSGADAAVRGQGELAFKALVDLRPWQSGRWSEIPNLTWRDPVTGSIGTNPSSAPVSLDQFKPYNFDLVDVEHYVRNDHSIASRTINYISSQGCPFDCGFCSDTRLFDRRWVWRSPERVASDLRRLVDEHDVNGVKFYDSNLFVAPKRVAELCRQLDRNGLRLRWGGACHPATFMQLDEDYLCTLSAAGCRRLLIGAESANKAVLKLVGKPIDPSDSLVIAKRCANHGIMVSFTFIVGFPGVHVRHIADTLDLGEQIRTAYSLHEVKVHIYAPFPMTRLYRHAQAHGFVPPTTYEGWETYDYYARQTRFISEAQENMVSEFNRRHSSAVHGSSLVRADLT